MSVFQMITKSSDEYLFKVVEAFYLDLVLIAISTSREEDWSIDLFAKVEKVLKQESVLHDNQSSSSGSSSANACWGIW